MSIPVSSARSIARRRYLASLVAGALLAASGCSSMSGGTGWWSSTGSSMYGASATTAKGISGQFKSMGTTVSSAFGKAKTAITAPFQPNAPAVSDKADPTSLASMPNQLTPELWVMQGQLAESQGQQAKALESYQKALQAEPNNLAALVSTARLYDRQGDAARSVEHFQKALAINPNDASIHNDLGLAYSKAGNAAAARDSLIKAANIDSSSVRYRNNLATLLVEQGQADEAVSQLKQVLPPAVAHYNVAYLHFTKQNVPAAQQQLQLALQADPNLQQARDLYNRLGGGQVVAQAASAYQLAGNIYQTAQGMAQPTATAAMPASGPTSLPAQSPSWLSTPSLAPGSYPVQ